MKFIKLNNTFIVNTDSICFLNSDNGSLFVHFSCGFSHQLSIKEYNKIAGALSAKMDFIDLSDNKENQNDAT